MNDEELILHNVAELRAEVLKNAMDPEHPPLILPVTKKQPVSRVLTLKKAGFCQIGENHAQEICSKYHALSTLFDIHYIGRLQTNKIKDIIGKACLVQSLDRWPLAIALDRKAQSLGVCADVLVQVNIGREAQKAGVTPEETEAFVRRLSGLQGLHVRGLMTVMPFTVDEEAIRPLFRAMRALFEVLRAEAVDGVAMDELSMGMSNDFVVAAQEGATMLRIGSAIFGNREA